MRRCIQWACILWAISFFATWAHAQSASASPTASPKPSPTTSSAASLEGLDSNLAPDPDERSSDLNPTRLPAGVTLDDATKAAYLSALRAQFEYQRTKMEHRANVFAWQLFSNRIIFFTVIILVLSGVYFSGIQFHSSMRASRIARELSQAKRRKLHGADLRKEGSKSGQSTDSAVEPEVAQPITELEASLTGIKVNSPILGVIILALSFLFFYLYIKFVYPIDEI